jgi:hypothetical protein
MEPSFGQHVEQVDKLIEEDPGWFFEEFYEILYDRIRPELLQQCYGAYLQFLFGRYRFDKPHRFGIHGHIHHVKLPQFGSAVVGEWSRLRTLDPQSSKYYLQSLLRQAMDQVIDQIRGYQSYRVVDAAPFRLSMPSVPRRM